MLSHSILGIPRVGFEYSKRTFALSTLPRVVRPRGIVNLLESWLGDLVILHVKLWVLDLHVLFLENPECLVVFQGNVPEDFASLGRAFPYASKQDMPVTYGNFLPEVHELLGVSVNVITLSAYVVVLHILFADCWRGSVHGLR